ncbi:hypothetical protein JCM19238_3630 [Vibrio ponticus]|nr:hypothetical protein JCM19238_3630 [Vibrio ponticus]
MIKILAIETEHSYIQRVHEELYSHMRISQQELSEEIS